MYNTPNGFHARADDPRAEQIGFDLYDIPSWLQVMVLRLANRGHSIDLANHSGSGSLRNPGSARVTLHLPYRHRNGTEQHMIHYSTAGWHSNTADFGDIVEDVCDAVGIEVEQQRNGSGGVEITDDRIDGFSI